MWSKLRGIIPFGSQELSCQKFHQMASEYLDGTLETRTLWRFSYHAERCRGCSASVSALRATIHVLHSLPPLEIPQELKQRIREQYLGGSSNADTRA